MAKRKKKGPVAQKVEKQTPAKSTVETSLDPVSRTSTTVVRKRVYRKKSEWENEQRSPGKEKRDKGKRLILISKRGSRASGGTCDECKTWYKPRWRYAESNRGVVYLCGRCKDIVFDRSHGKVDAMRVAVSGGAPESNRRRH